MVIEGAADAAVAAADADADADDAAGAADGISEEAAEADCGWHSSPERWPLAFAG